MANSGVVVVVAGQDNTEAVFKQIESNLKGVTERSHETEGALEKIGERGVRLLEYFGIEVAARAALDQIKELVGGSLEFGEAMEKASAKTGLSVGTLSTLHYAAGVTSSDFDAMSQAVARLDQNIGKAADGDKTAQSFMTALGLNAKQLAGQADGAEIAFKKFTQTIAATENPIERVRLATGLLGRAGAEQLDLLIKIGNNWDFYKQRATEAGVQLDGETASSLAETNARLKDMQQRVHGAGLAFTEGLVPGINALFDVIGGGKGSMDAFRDWGVEISKTFMTDAQDAYSLAAAMERVQAAGLNLARDTKGADAAYDSAMLDQKKADDAQFFAVNGYQHGWKESRAEHDAEGGGGGKPFTGAPVPDGAAAKLAAAKKARDAAMTRLDEQSAQLAAERAKSDMEARLAKLDEEHKKNLISDKDFYTQKLALQRDEIAKEEQAQEAKQTAIDTEIDGLTDDERAQSGTKRIQDETKILELRGRQSVIAGQIASLDAAGAKAESEAAMALDELKKKRLERSDELAAKREEIRGGSVAARLKQSADAYADKREGLVANYGANSAEVANADAGQADAQDQIRATGAEAGNGMANARLASRRAELDDAVKRGAMSAVDAQRQKIALDREEADALQPVLAAYQQLAAKDGDMAAAEKVIELQTKIRELNNPVDEVAAHMREQFDSAFQGLFDNLDRGTRGFQDFGRQIERIFMSEAYRRIIEPGVQAALGSIFPNARGSNPSNQVAGIGGFGKALGGLIPGVNKIPGVGIAAGKSGDVSVQIINQGSPMESGGASQSKTSDESGFESRVISVMLKNAETNGSVIQALAGALKFV